MMTRSEVTATVTLTVTYPSGDDRNELESLILSAIHGSTDDIVASVSAWKVDPMGQTTCRKPSCVGLDCPYAWHTGGCGPMWQYMDTEGYDISHQPYAERDAAERRRWDGPDEATLIEYRRGDRWEEA